jgi:hypothetical protein
LVSGSDISKWYSCDNYKDMEGQLGSSCMARKRNIFSIYENNPDVCQMLILTEDDKLIGRAIVWKVKSIEKMVALLIVSILWIDNILAKILML